VHLLSEENQALFEHVTLLRAHFDGFNKTCGETLEDAKAKSQAFDLVHGQVDRLLDERDRLLADKLEADRRLADALATLTAVEEERRGDQLELSTVKEQMLQFRTEYVQYKSEA
jgi:hypothetical protein